ncbi:MAG: hypothetical protein A3F31_01670 [Candidatus Levybacteria bacterium RIFCSPHIGHO2_12_FULL_38_12]|nr:MAG: hypothetical protein A2770_02590 [Candidatus Levybacteria bacterium RIFCSPHIGHO2_01_FULL_38_12]OGH22069.1 MAG: hypothetical protein A3D75_01555 [Candidatus Levybacteria bacterium RIFCSPHIGHO2_02_FULL_37_18]OGH22915.1 MAG: hypothetical protein A3F31_01670 [Candidatus Levybacteria bacterium RIFCSPHIGHO2_12_FULL_38_12]OGH34041.1 MAG: hypothetical protein A3A47_00160 [Candidatus Levybacteria bacterium RIFCSPLOWO2_01_FULL_37_20]OGH44901.1 MAG: hypothetical protein A3J14_02670 [Candidatus Lev
MNKGINLLPSKKGGLDKQKRILKLLRTVSIVVLVFLFTSFVTLFFINRQFSPDKVKQEERVVLANYSAINSRMAKLFLIHDRLSEIDRILSRRVPFEAKTTEIKKQVPRDMSIDSMRITPSLMEMTATSVSLSSINSMLDNFTQMANEKNLFKSVVLNGIGFDGKEKYFVTLKIQLL